MSAQMTIVWGQSCQLFISTFHFHTSNTRLAVTEGFCKFEKQLHVAIGCEWHYLKRDKRFERGKKFRKMIWPRLGFIPLTVRLSI